MEMVQDSFRDLPHSPPTPPCLPLSIVLREQQSQEPQDH